MRLLLIFSFHSQFKYLPAVSINFGFSRKKNNAFALIPKAFDWNSSTTTTMKMSTIKLHTRRQTFATVELRSLYLIEGEKKKRGVCLHHESASLASLQIAITIPMCISAEQQLAECLLTISLRNSREQRTAPSE